MELRRKRAFSIIEILLALIFVSFAFVPIYNLFRFGHVGTTSNINEVTATGYASDLVNFVRDLPFARVQQAMGNNSSIILENDAEIIRFFNNVGLRPPPEPSEQFTRLLFLEHFDGRDTSGIFGIPGFLRDLINDRRAVENYLIKVKVRYQRVPGASSEEEVILYSIVMEN